MKLLDRIFSGAKEKAATFAMTYLGFNPGMEDSYDAGNLNSYRDSLYLFIGVSMIRETVAGIPMEMYKIKNKEGDVEEIHDDPFLDLMMRPNDKQTQKEFMKLAVAYYLLAGETFWYLENGGENALPTAIVNMRPDHVEVLFSATRKEIVGYEFMQSDGQLIRLLPEEVLHIKNIDPTNPARGIGVVRPARQRIVSEQEAAKYQADTFRNQGRPDIAVFTDVDLTDEQATDSRERWDKIYNKANTKRAAGFFGNSIKDLKVLNTSPKEMEGMESMRFLRDDILAALRIPKQMIDTDVNYANSKVAYATYVRQACEPVLEAFYDVINNKWLTDISVVDDRFVTYETEVGEDREFIVKEAIDLKNARIINQNEARTLLNYPEVDGGDEFDEVGSMFQLAMKKKRLRKLARRQLKKRPVLLKKFKATEALADMYQKEKLSLGVRREQNSVFHTQEMKEGYIRAFNSNIKKKANTFKDHIEVYNDGLLKRIVKQMEDFGINPDRVFDATVEIVEAKSVFVPLMTAMYSKAGQDALDSVASGFSSTKASEQFYTIDQVIQELEARAEFFILSMLDTDFKQMRDIIADGLANGEGVPAIAKRLRGYFDDMSVARANTIARTETGRLISQATDEAYRQSEFVTGKEWLTARDNKVRDQEGTVNDHVHNDGEIVAPGGVFKNGERFPGELTINCRCAIAPAV